MGAHDGYNPKFLSSKLPVPLPSMVEPLSKDVAPVTDNTDGVLHYVHYSLCLSKSRRFPIYTATNINGKLFKNIKRDEVFASGADEWRVDPRAKQFQYGSELYNAPKSEFHKGHMTKREDPQWGSSKTTAREAAQSTFFYTNSVPQVEELNVREWGGLEKYILNTESIRNKMKINVFTGPVLSVNDPVFVTKVKGRDIQIPTVFWKIVYYEADGKLNKVGFMMGQDNLLLQKGVVRPRAGLIRGKGTFLDFDDAATYQVNIATIEKLSGLKFPAANEPFKDKRAVKLILKDIEVTLPGAKSMGRGVSAQGGIDIIYENITL